MNTAGMKFMGFAIWVSVAAIPLKADAQGIRLNELQYIGTHNSYHIEPDPGVMDLLEDYRYMEGEEWDWRALREALAYTHPSLKAQLQMGIRNFELDVLADQEGGRYASPKALAAAKRKGYYLVDDYDTEELLEQPGFKTIHMTDIDVRSTCLLFSHCLQEIKEWSDSNPQHIPIIVLIEPKIDARPAVTPDYQPVQPEPFDEETWRRFEQEILSIFSRDELITPDDVRGEHESIRAAVTDEGWPLVLDVLGKIMFILMHEGEATDVYMQGSETLEGRLLFANLPPNHPSASFVLITKPHKEEEYRLIQRYASRGYLVYTRGDANTVEARNNDLMRSSYAFLSGAQIVSTDYPYPDHRFSDYMVQFGDGVFVRCNKWVAREKCQ